MKKAISTKEAPPPIGPYSQAIDTGTLVFFSGQIPLHPTGDMVGNNARSQAEQVCKNIDAMLKAASLTWQNIVKTTIYLTDMNDFAAVNEIYGKHVPQEAPPARTTIAVAALPRNAKVEIEITALRG